MALDTKYRPRTYDDVLGQEATVAVLRQFVKEKKGYHQSYVFCGQHGSGKTTLGRVLARSLLCSSPVDGNPCDQCPSCETLLSGGTHECFEELDAASKSKKEDLERIVEDVTYSTFSGRRRIYLFDESHRLSKAAFDILLKPMEDSIEGSEDKRLVCIFCTTDPAKMSTTIFSRCAPAFVIRPVTPEVIGKRLLSICEKEGIAADLESLVTIAELSECHIRDALKDVEGVSMLGGISRENVFKYLQLGANDVALSLVEALGVDLRAAMTLAAQMSQEISPSSAYERIAEAAICAYRAHLGVGKIPSQWNASRIQELAKRGPSLLGISSRFASPPYRPTAQTLVLDIGTTHYGLVGGVPVSQSLTISISPQALISTAPQPSPVPPKEIPKKEVVGEGSIHPQGEVSPRPPSGVTEAPVARTSSTKDGTPPRHEDEFKNSAGVWIVEKAVGGSKVPTTEPTSNPDALDPQLFRDLVRHHLRGMKRVSRGPR